MEIVTHIFAFIGYIAAFIGVMCLLVVIPEKIKDRNERHVRWIVDNEIRILADNGWIKKLVEENKDGDENASR